MHVLNEERYMDELSVSGTKDPTQNSNVCEKADACWGQQCCRSIDGNFEDTAEVSAAFDGMAGFQACS